MEIKPLPPKTLAHFYDLYRVASVEPDTPIDVRGINNSCIRAMFTRGLIEYQFLNTNGKSERHVLFTEAGLAYGKNTIALVPDSTSESRKREVLRVYLDMGNEAHSEAWNVAQSLAGERILTPTLVDLLLMHSEFLSQNTTTLAEAYPGVYQLLTETRQADLFARLEALVHNTPQADETAPIPRVQPVTSSQGIRQLQTPQFAAPDYENDDDIELSVVADANAGKRANENFLASMRALNP